MLEFCCSYIVRTLGINVNGNTRFISPFQGWRVIGYERWINYWTVELSPKRWFGFRLFFFRIVGSHNGMWASHATNARFFKNIFVWIVDFLFHTSLYGLYWFIFMLCFLCRAIEAYCGIMSRNLIIFHQFTNGPSLLRRSVNVVGFLRFGCSHHFQMMDFRKS